jgi:anion-transporting  ArsA/GET3 family ATPase
VQNNYVWATGTDEVVAMTNIVKYLEEGITTANGDVIKFDRVVLDTVILSLLFTY